MYAIGCLTVIAFVGYLIISYYLSKEDTAKENRELISKNGKQLEFEKFRNANRNLSETQALLKFYADKEEKKKAIANAEERDQIIKEIQDEYKRDQTIKRVFAYNHENFIFALFSPLSKLIGGEKWSCWEQLPKDYVLNKIKIEYRLSDSEAQNLYNQFIENNLLEEEKPSPDDEVLTDAIELVSVGFILTFETNIVSEQDLDMDKYIRQHGRRCTREQLIAEIKRMRM